MAKTVNPFKITLFFASLLSILHVCYGSKLPFILAKTTLYAEDYDVFSKEFKNLALLMGLLLFLSVFWKSPKTTNQPSSKNWMIGFFLLLGMGTILVAFTNPTGRFPWNERESYVTVAARSIKPNLYAKLDQTPKLIILGSSVSLTTPADYLKKKWGINAFNMSLNAGTLSDFVNTMNYIIQQSPDGKTPSVILVEMVSPTLKTDNSDQTPVKMLHYMPINQAIPALSEAVDSLFKLTPLSNSVFTLLFVDTHRWKVWITFSADGTGTRAGAQESPADYQAAIKSSAPIMKSLISCKKLDPIGKEYIKKLIDLSHQHQFSIVFYRTPINNDFYKISQTNPDKYLQCKKEFDEYMMALTLKNRNIFYKDLSEYAEISTQGMTVYMDTHHLKKSGAILLMDALDQEIAMALKWAKQRIK